LFPQRAKDFVEGSGLAQPYFEVVRRRGIGVLEGYDAYFSLFPSPNAVSKVVIDTAMQKLDDEAAITALINEYLGKTDRRKAPMIAKLLQEIGFRFEGAAVAKPTPEPLNALVKSGDTIMTLDWEGDMFQTSPRTAYQYLVKNVLKVWGPEEAARQLEAIINKAGSVFIPVSLVVERARELGDLPRGGRQDPVISTEAARSLARKLLPKIKAAAADGSLAKFPFFAHVVQCWKYAGDAKRAKKWITKNAGDDPRFLAKVALSQLNYTLGSERTYSMNQAPDPDIYDYQPLHHACTFALKNADLNAEQRKQIEAFDTGLMQLIEQEAKRASESAPPKEDYKPSEDTGA
jgi:hypothetical protein